MSDIQGSVGQGGDNAEPDVRIVQKALNRFDLTPLTALAVDGRCGPRTIESIRHFQTRNVGIANPDGRVDPGGRTMRRLDTGSGERGTGQSPETRAADRQLRAERVDPRVQETAVTTRLIDHLIPRFGSLRAKIIGGFLSDSDQFWKVNYHWEYLLTMTEHSLTLSLDRADQTDLQNLASSLRGCAPTPSCGYTSSPVGKPVDNSSAEDALRRYQVLRSGKETFGRVTQRADLKKKSTRSAAMFDLAAAPVASPGKSKHGSGYALDIQGDNNGIKSLCSGLGATLVFDEKSHVHVEFKNGLAAP
ncbi:peptidoglycan-binding domain-containing protein [Kribbia dieselivorans]|uniref:peptidoglycan-binding domain-containing protein n=1 Tax=Kribbia dieselivorans TaxID=331526 RepID=UPI00147032E1|nr:peptidoglycan-binding protein [Kribbia dieselivorans]